MISATRLEFPQMSSKLGNQKLTQSDTRQTQSAITAVEQSLICRRERDE